MTSRFAVAAAVVLLAGSGPVGVADDRDDAVREELEKLRGTWEFVSRERDGELGDPRDGETITFEGEKFTVSRDGAVIQAGTQQVDPTRSPKTVDVFVTEGIAKGATWRGIYRLEGDTLETCFSWSGKPRPEEFETSPGSDRFITVVRRQESGDRDEAVEAGLAKFQGVWVPVSIEGDGEALPPDDVEITHTYEGDRFTLRRGGEVVEQGTIRIDPSRSPKTIDLHMTRGPQEGETGEAIYEFDGDALRICFNRPGLGKPRPDEFTTAPGSGRVLLVARPRAALDEAAIRALIAESTEAAERGDLDRLMADYADDAIVIPPRDPAISGAAAIRADLERSFAGGRRFSMEPEPTLIEVSRSGDLAYATGTFRTTARDGDGRETLITGTFTSIFRKRGDEGWKTVLDTWTVTSPGPGDGEAEAKAEGRP